ncbi:hypothetical protein AVEN_120864-1 [Araneus ventricosus]|uniref:Uncharacterized protein n=1 Tax=Araneus ventricosus TaxID=182803 RepID=A0A4Y2K2E3_ARAVE|nr:hypothetical protein AVEN_120864-1 [Araneus ventricosus]
MRYWSLQFSSWGGAIDPDFISKNNNVRPHRDHLVDEFLESEDIRRRDWPADFRASPITGNFQLAFPLERTTKQRCRRSRSNCHRES